MIVYLISDDLKMHELLAGGLKELLTGDTVIAAFPLRKAKMMIAHRKPSVIVLDIDAGEQFDAAAYIKELCPRYSIPIIVVTASKSPQSALLSAGAIDIILHQSGTAADEKLLQRVSTSIISSVSIIKPRFYPQKISDCERVIVIGGSTGSTNALPVVLKGLPAQVLLSETELFEAIEDDTFAIMEAIRKVLEEAPPELVGDIYDNGLLLTGGGALLGGLTQLIKRTLGINCNIAKDSINCVAKGTGMAFGRMTTLLDGFEAATVYKYR